TLGEGHAAWPTEGGGDKALVLNVTSLADSGPGTFRAAVMIDKPRRIVFKVAGEIFLKKPLTIENPYVTVAGETAPSP
ncbi:right-handed parallel beta-helix repeat-containing protein, partial [Escherichia coli]